MKQNARIASVALSLLVIAACGGGDAAPPANSAANPPAGTAAATTTAPKDAPKPAADAPLPAGVKEVKTADLVVPPYVKSAVDAADRSPEDRALDAGRKPDLLMTFAGIKPGMKVADLCAGGGYTTEMIARTVGPTGKVWGQNSPDMMERFLKKPWGDRLAKPADAAVVSAIRAFDDPLPDDAKDLDAVTMVLFYHDLYWVGTDRTKMNAAIMKSLKPGGVFVVVDHNGRPGTGATEVKTLHRIEESEVIKDVTAAGFKLTESADFLRNPDDKRDWNDSPMAAGAQRGKSDRFVLKFQKP